jgi:hypothetical protein
VAALITSSSCRGESIPIQAFRTVPVLSTNSRVGVPETFSTSKGTPARARTLNPSDCTTSLTGSTPSGKTATIAVFEPSGRTMALCGLRMMPRFPSPP